MIAEAELFLQADQAVVAVFSAIRDDQWELLLPPVFDMPGADQPIPLRTAVDHYAYDNSWVPDMLAGRTMDEVGRDRFDGDLLGDDPTGQLVRIGAAAAAAARQVDDRDGLAHFSYGDAPIWNYFWQLNIARTLSAHDTAAVIGASCPLSEELSRRMWEGTEPMAQVWRAYGVYREALPVPGDAARRDRFLALSGRRP